MKDENPQAITETLYVCRLCGKVGIKTVPSGVDFGGCVPPNTSHIFQALEVVVKPKA